MCAFAYASIHTSIHTTYTHMQKKINFGKQQEFCSGQRGYWLWGKVMPDESDEILIRIQEWKFVRNFLTACQNGHFNQTCFSSLSSRPRLFWRSEHPRFQGFHHKTCFLVIGKPCKNLLNPEIWHQHSSMECGPFESNAAQGCRSVSIATVAPDKGTT